MMSRGLYTLLPPLQFAVGSLMEDYLGLIS